MSANWDFRSILDVYPDRSSFTCVGVTQKGARCGQRMFSGSDLSCASRLLDEMSTLRKLSSSYKYLEELAELTLCPRWHRKPGYSQVRSVSRRWQNKIAKIEREQEKTAMVKSDALADMTKNIDNMIKRLEEIHNKLSIASPQNHQEQEEISDATSWSSQQNGSLTTDMIVENQLPVALPSPPASPLEAPRSYEIKQEQSVPSSPTEDSKTSSPQQHLITISKTSSTEIAIKDASNDVAPEAISRERTKIESLNIEFPPTPDTTPAHARIEQDLNTSQETHNLSSASWSGKFPLLTFDKGITAELPNTKQLARSSFTNSIKDISVFSSTTQHKTPSKSFDSSTPTKMPYAIKLSEKPSMLQEFNDHVDKKSRKEIENRDVALIFSTEDPFVSTESSKNTPQPPSTPVKVAPICSSIASMRPEATPEPTARDLTYTEEETYGYAIVTASSTCYKAFLPAAQRHGLMTPPETPEVRMGEIQDPSLAITSGTIIFSATASLLKPLPNLPTLQARSGSSCMCEACSSGENDCCCYEESSGEDGKVGCFHSLRLRRLRKRIEKKIKDAKTRVSEKLHRSGSTTP